MKKEKLCKICINTFLVAIILYGLGRLYFQLTAGFTESNIVKELPSSTKLKADLPHLASINEILKQPFSYLGKGCQSYVFLSEDGNYVIKFLKLQRYNLNFFQELVKQFPPFKEKIRRKEEEKNEKLLALINSFKLSYDNLKEETGIIHLHVEKEPGLMPKIHIIDKLGLSHELDSNEVLFLIQRRANSLESTINDLMAKRDEKKAKELIDHLVDMIVSEYQKGFGDDDHALLQNTGVIDGRPIHIDIGRFSYQERYKDPSVYTQELYNKTYRFRKWLENRYPSLEKALHEKLLKIIGPKMETMTPKLKIVEEGD